MRGQHWRGVSTEARHFLKCLLEMDVDLRFSAEQGEWCVFNDCF